MQANQENEWDTRRLRYELDEVRAHLELIQLSTFWRLTKPLRFIADLIKGIGNSELQNPGLQAELSHEKSVLFVSGSNGPSFTYRTLNQIEQLKLAGFRAKYCLYDDPQLEIEALSSQALILHRPPPDQRFIGIIKRCQNCGIKVIFDTDDIIFDLEMEKYLHLNEYMSESELSNFRLEIKNNLEMIKACDAVVASTHYLATQIRSFHQQVFVNENAVSSAQQKIFLEIRGKEKNLRKSTVTIGYFSGWPDIHNYDFRLIAAVFVRIFQNYPQARLFVQGYLTLPTELEMFEDRISRAPFSPWEEAMQRIHQVDINIAPLDNNPHKRAKSAVKVYEAALLGVPTVATRLEPYEKHIKDGITGFLAVSEEEWYQKLSKLIIDTDFRASLGLQARLLAEESYLIKAHREHYRQIWTEILSEAKANQVVVSDFKNNPSVPLNHLKIRESCAEQYLVGAGIEIGALHMPMTVPKKVKVRYLDRLLLTDLRRQYPELDKYAFVTPDLIDDGETLFKLMDESEDFIIANHFLEHCRNPIGALNAFLRVVRRDGIIFIVVPDKRYSGFDTPRETTTLEHLLRDAREGPEWSDDRHHEDWVRATSASADEKTILERIRRNKDMNYSIHFHTWTAEELFELIFYMQSLKPFRIELYRFNIHENIFVLRKS